MKYRYLLFLLVPHISYPMATKRVVRALRPANSIVRAMATKNQFEERNALRIARLAHLKQWQRDEHGTMLDMSRTLNILKPEERLKLKMYILEQHKNRAVAIEKDIFDLEMDLTYPIYRDPRS